jgi:hypothetical protein
MDRIAELGDGLLMASGALIYADILAFLVRRGEGRRRQKNGADENAGERDGGRDERRPTMMVFHPLFSFVIVFWDILVHSSRVLFI